MINKKIKSRIAELETLYQVEYVNVAEHIIELIST